MTYIIKLFFLNYVFISTSICLAFIEINQTLTNGGDAGGGPIRFKATIPVGIQHQNPVNSRLPQVQNGKGKLAKNDQFLNLISTTSACSNEVQKYCKPLKYDIQSNYDVLECLSVEVNSVDLSSECSHYIWQYKLNMTTNKHFQDAVQSICQDALKMHTHCSTDQPDASMITCLAQEKERIKNPTCVHFLTKIEVIIFSDFHLIDGFVNDCKDDILRHKCGKLSPSSLHDNTQLFGGHSQENVVDCLIRKNLSIHCRKQIERLAELSADDYHLDKNLYMNCRNDRETFCENVISGEGRVFQCLFKHKMDNKMSLKCKEALTARQHLIAQDYKASSTLVQHCKLDIERNNCEHLSSITGESHGDDGHMVHLSSILLCLENSHQKGIPLSNECQREMYDYRQMLLSDYQLSPEITEKCGTEIVEKCENGIEKEGKTLHCLFHLATENDGLSPDCHVALTNLLKETEVASDYRIDHVLVRKCQSAIQHKCSQYEESDPMIVGCLVEHRYDNDMSSLCREAVTDIQYFVSRNFMVDPEFLQACQADAKRFCFAPIPKPPHLADLDKEDNSPNMPLSLVISCLYRNIYPVYYDVNNDDMVVSIPCQDEVYRLIKQRALSVDLNPDIERSCRQDLGRFCSETVHNSGSEFLCLQDHYNDLNKDCRSVVEKYTKLESKDPLRFESILIEECEPMMKKFCGSLLQNEKDGSKIMHCLIASKDKMESKKCAAGITHFQLIEMKDFNLDVEFTKACFNDIHQRCGQQFTHGTTAEVIKCLSEKKRNEILDAKAPPLSDKCKEQITIEKLQMHEDIRFNPTLEENCRSDYKSLCPHVKTGEAKVLECLREHKDSLSKNCYAAIYTLEEEESENRNLDYQLMEKCEVEIKKHCVDEVNSDESDYVLDCLIENKHVLSKICAAIVTEREKEIFSDISLNLDLLASCKSDIDRFCADEKRIATLDHKENRDPHGIIYECLKDQFSQKRLTPDCHKHIEDVIREQQQNYILDPQLTLKCVKSIQTHCPPKGNFNVVECLKKRFYEGTLQDEKSCMLEVAKLLNEGFSDIMADPILQQSCSDDLQQHCSSIPEGHGRLITCLVNAANSGMHMNPQCFEQLQLRKEMWKKAVKGVEGFGDLKQALVESEHSSYILSVLTLFTLVILILGFCFGRITKRVKRMRRHVL